MGKTIEGIALQRGNTVNLKIDLDSMASFTKENLQQCDVAIEFSVPSSAVMNIIACFNAGIPVVCGTTGWTEKFTEVKNLIASLEADAEKFYNKGNSAAGTRVRKGMQDLKNLAQSIRLEVQEAKNKA